MAHTSKGRKTRYAYYRCRSTTCRNGNVPKAELESDFVHYLQAVVPKREYLALFREIALTESALYDARLDELDVEGVLNFADYFLAIPARL